MTCVFKKALENEVEHYKKDGDIKSFMQYLYYFKGISDNDCVKIISSSLSFDDMYNLAFVVHDFQSLLSKLLQRRDEYLSSNKTESDFKKYSFFINSIDWEEFNYDEMSSIHKEIIKGLDNYTWGEITI